MVMKDDSLIVQAELDKTQRNIKRMYWEHNLQQLALKYRIGDCRFRQVMSENLECLVCDNDWVN
jgi:hypothetical protein